MATVETARGPIDSAALGRTLMHEHVFVLTQPHTTERWDEAQKVADAIGKLNEVATAGISTIVDPTVTGLGPDIARIAVIADQVDVNIIVATGLYTYTDIPRSFPGAGSALQRGGDPMVDFFVKEVTEGIQKTSVKAGILKCAIDRPGMTPDVERVLRSIARAHLETGVPIMVHTHPGTKRGLEVRDVLASEGVAPNHVMLSHSGDTTDADHLSELAADGFLLGMDRFGMDIVLDFEGRVDVVAELCRRGYASQMVLSQDASAYIDWAELPRLPPMANWHYMYVLRDVLPALRDRGVTEAHIDEMFLANPRRFFEG